MEVIKNCGLSQVDGRSVNEGEALWDRSAYTIPPQQGASSDTYHGPLRSTSQNTAQIARKPVASRAQAGVATSPARPASPNARIIGPRAMGPRFHPASSPGIASAYGKENLAPRTRSAQPVAARSRSPTQMQITESSTKFDHSKGANPILNATSWEPPLVGSERILYDKPNEPGPVLVLKEDCPSLTLIRRYDGSQKNVGRILNDLFNTQSIHINTLGYSIFQSPSTTESPVSLGPVFECRLGRLGRYSTSPESGQNNLHENNDRTSRMSIDLRRVSRPHSEDNSNSHQTPAHPEDLKSSSMRGYRFPSPWNGTCDFSSGFTGQTLRCKHTAPTPGSPAVTVSELRFNLPSSSTTSVASPRMLRSPDLPTTAKRASYFSSRHRSESSIGEDHTQHVLVADPMDHPNLLLGREKAGGGFGGKQAKLGKLIVEAEGLKMLDLVVAANMGLWWKAYEKSA
ncbi:MAG: hypothetical protein LQ352_003996 [Teloschistes flavicans]|nr:MAG: hypothetical protein LQ352_003996 [Teloschistes flavicans]